MQKIRKGYLNIICLKEEILKRLKSQLYKMWKPRERLCSNSVAEVSGRVLCGLASGRIATT